jgi:hypothetical protein
MFVRPCRDCEHTQDQHRDDWVNAHFLLKCKCKWYERMNNLEYLEWCLTSKETHNGKETKRLGIHGLAV